MAILLAAGCSPDPPGRSVSVQVSLEGLGPEFQLRLRGVMVGSWENPSTAAFTAERLGAAGVAFLEFPGGLEADGYNWQAPESWQIGPAQFAALANAVGAVTRMCIVDYRANDPAKAAAWVGESRRQGWGVTYWEVGDEEYGEWSGSASPQQYAERFRRYCQAMKAADPTIEVGASVTFADPTWTQSTLSLIGDIVDWVALSYYPQDPGTESDAGLLASTDGLASIIGNVRDWLAAAAPGRMVEVFITGWNSVSYDPGPQTLSVVNGLFAADAIGVMASAGVDAAGLFCAQMARTPTGGTYGLFDSGTDPGAGRPAYWGLRAWARADGRLVASQTDQDAIRCWAVAGADRVLLILINRDGGQAFDTSVALAGYSPPPGEAVVSRYDGGHPTLTEIDRMPAAAGLQLALPPYSLTVVEMPR